MQLFATIVLWAWLPIVMLMFRDLRGHRAMSVGYVVAWLFLPTLEIPFRGVPDYDKLSATSLGIGIASLLFDSNLWLRFKPRIWDLSLIVLILWPIASASANNLGARHAISGVLTHLVRWGAPYLLGRLYFDTFEKLSYFARTIFLGGVVYIPFCLVEMRMSPQFSNWVYGIQQRVGMAIRYGGWRPSVFLDNGLELGMWMTAATLTGFGLWFSGGMRQRKFLGVREAYCLGLLFIVTILCKATGALVLLMASAGTLVAIRSFNFRWVVLGLTAIPALYISVRTTDTQSAMALVPIARSMFGEDRAQSLEFRFINENMLVERASEQFFVGWGGWGRNLVHDEWGNIATIPDGLWVILFGEHGMVAVVCFYVTMVLAPTAACLRFGQLKRWKFEEVAPTLSLALFLLIYAVDCLLNAMENAVYPVALGGLTTVLSIRDANKLRVKQNEDFVEVVEVVAAVPRRAWPPLPTRSETADLVELESEQAISLDAGDALPDASHDGQESTPAVLTVENTPPTSMCQDSC